MSREDEVRDWVINAIANDYEDFEQVIDQTRRWATKDGRVAPSPTEDENMPYYFYVTAEGKRALMKF